MCLCYRKDAFTGTEYIQEGLQIEQASVLYNLCESTSLHGGYREEGRKGGMKGGRKGGMEEEREGGRRGSLNYMLITNYLEVHEWKNKDP